ncbi:hypothetical protein D3C81_2056940 [compost metagenome]
MQGGIGQVEAPVLAQPERIAQHPLLFQAIQQATRSGSGRDVEHPFGGNIQGLLEGDALLPAGEGYQQAGKEQACLQHQQEFAYHESDVQ